MSMIRYHKSHSCGARASRHDARHWLAAPGVAAPRPAGLLLAARASATPAKSAGARPYTREDSWRYWPPQADQPGGWRGCVGNWYRDVHDPSGQSLVQALRTWRRQGAGGAPQAQAQAHEQVVVYNREVPGASLRDEDGLFEERSELRQECGLNELPRRLSVGPDAAVQLRSLQLPPVALGGAQPATRTGDGGGEWGFELFLQDGACRWSLVLLYSTLTGELSKVTFVQEYDTRADPATPHVLAEAATGGAIQPPRPPLKRHFAATWVPRGTLGKVTARVWATPTADGGGGGGGGGGGSLMLDEAVAGQYPDWAAASSLSGPPLLVLPLPDAMYLRAPASLKGLRQAQQQQQAQQQAQGGERAVAAAFEFGGLLRSVEGGLQRVVVRYDAAAADGGFVDATREVFVRGNKFEKQAAAASRTSSS
ncbi:hypothetical protein HYH02_002213 [Chlamydomonas schloesseri]|uniref:Uncharacterized protein n=1 Tax=Chlamydomonas schloesseri TaxID=2026947 RepID=A0A835WT12_9CHLO|nr:hypothetical protein HYH02_002213 [Chlamydomonas schloesseri]|eukprot:KAG2452869.1 hypothetical protein HYH02_002213 [Chlamydomonas schloesseri]